MRREKEKREEKRRRGEITAKAEKEKARKHYVRL